VADPNSLETLTVEQRQDLALAKLTRQLLGNPETRGTVQRLLTKADANLKFPELDIQDRIDKVKEDTAKQVQEAQEEARRLRAEIKQRELHSKVTSAGLELEPVMKLMEKHGLAPTDENYDLAIKVLSRDAEDSLAESTPSPFPSLNAPDLKEMAADPEKWRTNMAEQVLREVRGSRRTQ
jgi:hypothetical protein